MSIEAVTFDLDNTLLRYRESPNDVLDRCFDRTGHEPFFSFGDYLDVFGEFVNEADSPLELRTKAFTALARERGYDPAAGRDIAETWGEAHAEAAVELCPGAERVLEACSRSVDIGLITNGPSEAQRPKMKTLGLTDRFDAEVYAADDLRFKPDPHPFQRALDALDTRDEATVHVGDSLEADVEGAIDVGMQAIWIADGEHATHEHPVPTVETVGDLLDLSEFSRIA